MSRLQEDTMVGVDFPFMKHSETFVLTKNAGYEDIVKIICEEVDVDDLHEVYLCHVDEANYCSLLQRKPTEDGTLLADLQQDDRLSVHLLHDVVGPKMRVAQLLALCRKQLYPRGNGKLHAILDRAVTTATAAGNGSSGSGGFRTVPFRGILDRRRSKGRSSGRGGAISSTHSASTDDETESAAGAAESTESAAGAAADEAQADDGNGHYRAVYFGLFEALIVHDRREGFRTVHDLFRSFGNVKNSLGAGAGGLDEADVEEQEENFAELLQSLLLASRGAGWRTVAELECDLLNREESCIDLACVQALRRVVADFIITNREVVFALPVPLPATVLTSPVNRDDGGNNIGNMVASVVHGGISENEFAIKSKQPLEHILLHESSAAQAGITTLEGYCERRVEAEGAEADSTLVHLGIVPLALQCSCSLTFVDRCAIAVRPTEGSSPVVSQSRRQADSFQVGEMALGIGGINDQSSAAYNALPWMTPAAVLAAVSQRNGGKLSGAIKFKNSAKGNKRRPIEPLAEITLFRTGSRDFLGSGAIGGFDGQDENALTYADWKYSWAVLYPAGQPPEVRTKAEGKAAAAPSKRKPSLPDGLAESSDENKDGNSSDTGSVMSPNGMTKISRREYELYTKLLAIGTMTKKEAKILALKFETVSDALLFYAKNGNSVVESAPSQSPQPAGPAATSSSAKSTPVRASSRDSGASSKPKPDEPEGFVTPIPAAKGAGLDAAGKAATKPASPLPPPAAVQSSWLDIFITPVRTEDDRQQQQEQQKRKEEEEEEEETKRREMSAEKTPKGTPVRPDKTPQGTVFTSPAALISNDSGAEGDDGNDGMSTWKESGSAVKSVRIAPSVTPLGGKDDANVGWHGNSDVVTPIPSVEKSPKSIMKRPSKPADEFMSPEAKEAAHKVEASGSAGVGVAVGVAGALDESSAAAVEKGGPERMKPLVIEVEDEVTSNSGPASGGTSGEESPSPSLVSPGAGAAKVGVGRVVARKQAQDSSPVRDGDRGNTPNLAALDEKTAQQMTIDNTMANSLPSALLGKKFSSGNAASIDHFSNTSSPMFVNPAAFPVASGSKGAATEGDGVSGAEKLAVAFADVGSDLDSAGGRSGGTGEDVDSSRGRTGAGDADTLRDGTGGGQGGRERSRSPILITIVPDYALPLLESGYSDFDILEAVNVGQCTTYDATLRYLVRLSKHQLRTSGANQAAKRVAVNARPPPISSDSPRQRPALVRQGSSSSKSSVMSFPGDRSRRAKFSPTVEEFHYVPDRSVAGHDADDHADGADAYAGEGDQDSAGAMGTMYVAGGDGSSSGAGAVGSRPRPQSQSEVRHAMVGGARGQALLPHHQVPSSPRSPQQAMAQQQQQQQMLMQQQQQQRQRAILIQRQQQQQQQQQYANEQFNPPVAVTPQQHQLNLQLQQVKLQQQQLKEEMNRLQRSQQIPGGMGMQRPTQQQQQQLVRMQQDQRMLMQRERAVQQDRRLLMQKQRSQEAMYAPPAQTNNVQLQRKSSAGAVGSTTAGRPGMYREGSIASLRHQKFTGVTPPASQRQQEQQQQRKPMAQPSPSRAPSSSGKSSGGGMGGGTRNSMQHQQQQLSVFFGGKAGSNSGKGAAISAGHASFYGNADTDNSSVSSYNSNNQYHNDAASTGSSRGRGNIASPRSQPTGVVVLTEAQSSIYKRVRKSNPSMTQKECIDMCSSFQTVDEYDSYLRELAAGMGDGTGNGTGNGGRSRVGSRGGDGDDDNGSVNSAFSSVSGMSALSGRSLGSRGSAGPRLLSQQLDSPERQKKQQLYQQQQYQQQMVPSPAPVDSENSSVHSGRGGGRGGGSDDDSGSVSSIEYLANGAPHRYHHHNRNRGAIAIDNAGGARGSTAGNSSSLPPPVPTFQLTPAQILIYRKIKSKNPLLNNKDIVEIAQHFETEEEYELFSGDS